MPPDATGMPQNFSVLGHTLEWLLVGEILHSPRTNSKVREGENCQRNRNKVRVEVIDLTSINTSQKYEGSNTNRKDQRDIHENRDNAVLVKLALVG
jgi:hypothetical protein